MLGLKSINVLKIFARVHNCQRDIHMLCYTILHYAILNNDFCNELFLIVSLVVLGYCILLHTLLHCHLLMVINLLAMYFLLSSIPYSTISEICNSFCLFTFCCSQLRLSPA